MVGLRVFDVGALIAWLVWFYRLREDDDDGPDDPGPGDDPRDDAPQPPLPGADPWPRRRRDHTGDLTPGEPGRRRAPRPGRTPNRA